MTAHLFDLPPDRPGWFFVSVQESGPFPILVHSGVSGDMVPGLYVFLQEKAFSVTDSALRWHGPVPMPVVVPELEAAA